MSLCADRLTASQIITVSNVTAVFRGVGVEKRFLKNTGDLYREKERRGNDSD